MNTENLELVFENNAAILFAYAETMMERHGVTAEEMTREMCDSLAAHLLSNLEWIADGVREIRAERAAQ